MAKRKTVDDIRKETFADMLVKLNEHHIVAIPRPTGFGKTCMATDLIKTGKYKNILYFYPAEVIQNAVLERYYSDYDLETKKTMVKLKEIDNVTMMTYTKLAIMKDKEFDELKGIDLIIFDECHRLGANKALPKALALIKANPGADVIGMTATPSRSDGYDVIENVFEGITVFPYTLHDAFKDGVYKVPYYCFNACDQSLPKMLTSSAFMAGENIEDLRVQKVLKRRILEITRDYTNARAIRETCDEILDTNYMKFICFFTCHAKLLELGTELISDFKEAYPDHKIRTIEVSSRNSEVAKNVDKLKTLTFQDKTIDLIFAVDMLNMGYHVDDISGIIMRRTTTSDIIYPQEYGRVLSSGSDKEHVIFDLVDNLHRQAIFNNPVTRGNKGGKLIDVPPVTPPDESGDEPGIDSGGNGVIDGGPEGGGEFPGIFTGPDGGEDPRGSSDDDDADIGCDDETSKLRDAKAKWYLEMNNLAPEDVKFTHYVGTYREQMAKLVGEPMQMRCKEAFEAHFKRWCMMNKIPYPISNKELEEVYQLSKKDFVKYFENLIRKNKIDYPMRDAQKLLDIGKKRKDGLPMDVFAKWKNISVGQILDLLDVA